MLFRSILLPTLIVPTVGATIAVLLLRWGLREERSVRARGAGAAALAFLSGFVALTGWPRWPPVEATQRLFFVVAVCAVVAWIADPERRRVSAWLVRGVVTAVLLGLILQAQLQHSWTGVQGVSWLSMLFLVGLALHWAWAESFGKEGQVDSWVAGVVRIVLLVGIATILGMSGSARLAQLTGALTCGVGVVEVGSRVLRRRPWHRSAALVPATALLGLLTAGYFYADLQRGPAALSVAACLLLGVPLGQRRWLRLFALAPLALAVGLSVQAMLSQPEDPYADYYGELQPDERPSLVYTPRPKCAAFGSPPWPSGCSPARSSCSSSL